MRKSVHLNGGERRGIGGVAAALVLCVTLTGCATQQTGGDPGARPMPSGMSCQSVRADMDRLLSRGVQSRVQASQSGKKLPPQQQADVDQYNRLLGYYLGARCHQ
jgi:hypothetical protein